jgi:hypothetical protein
MVRGVRKQKWKMNHTSMGEAKVWVVIRQCVDLFESKEENLDVGENERRESSQGKCKKTLERLAMGETPSLIVLLRYLPSRYSRLLFQIRLFSVVASEQELEGGADTLPGLCLHAEQEDGTKAGDIAFVF